MGSVLLIFLVFCVSVCVCVCVCAGFVSLVASVSGLCTIGGPSILSHFYLIFFIFSFMSFDHVVMPSTFCSSSLLYQFMSFDHVVMPSTYCPSSLLYQFMSFDHVVMPFTYCPSSLRTKRRRNHDMVKRHK
jgi:hypothetical protein